MAAAAANWTTFDDDELNHWRDRYYDEDCCYCCDDDDAAGDDDDDVDDPSSMCPNDHRLDHRRRAVLVAVVVVVVVLLLRPHAISDTIYRENANGSIDRHHHFHWQHDVNSDDECDVTIDCCFVVVAVDLTYLRLLLPLMHLRALNVSMVAAGIGRFDRAATVADRQSQDWYGLVRAL